MIGNYICTLLNSYTHGRYEQDKHCPIKQYAKTAGASSQQQAGDTTYSVYLAVLVQDEFRQRDICYGLQNTFAALSRDGKSPRLEKCIVGRWKVIYINT